MLAHAQNLVYTSKELMPTQYQKDNLEAMLAFTKLPTDAIARLNTIINLGAEIHISDARGTDRLVQEYLKQQCYERVTVWHLRYVPLRTGNWG